MYSIDVIKRYLIELDMEFLTVELQECIKGMPYQTSHTVENINLGLFLSKNKEELHLELVSKNNSVKLSTGENTTSALWRKV